jgi:hypothetical protein
MTRLIYENIMQNFKIDIIDSRIFILYLNLKKYQHKSKNIHNEKIHKNITNQYHDQKEMI